MTKWRVYEVIVDDDREKLLSDFIGEYTDLSEWIRNYALPYEYSGLVECEDKIYLPMSAYKLYELFVEKESANLENYINELIENKTDNKTEIFEWAGMYFIFEKVEIFNKVGDT